MYKLKSIVWQGTRIGSRSREQEWGTGIRSREKGAGGGIGSRRREEE